MRTVQRFRRSYLSVPALLVAIGGTGVWLTAASAPATTQSREIQAEPAHAWNNAAFTHRLAALGIDGETLAGADIDLARAPSLSQLLRQDVDRDASDKLMLAFEAWTNAEAAFMDTATEARRVGLTTRLAAQVDAVRTARADAREALFIERRAMADRLNLAAGLGQSPVGADIGFMMASNAWSDLTLSQRAGASTIDELHALSAQQEPPQRPAAQATGLFGADSSFAPDAADDDRIALANSQLGLAIEAARR